MHSFNLPIITQGGIFWNCPIEIQWLKFVILLLLSQYQLLHFCTSESLINRLSHIKRWSSFHKCRSKEVQIVYRLLQVNLLHVPRFPTQPASYMGGWVIDSIGWNCLDKYIAMTRNNLSIVWISLLLGIRCKKSHKKSKDFSQSACGSHFICRLHKNLSAYKVWIFEKN